MKNNRLAEHHNHMNNLIEKLLELNPLLADKNLQELIELVEAIHECGYEWDENKKFFYNKKINNAIRTQGLDLFNAKKFKEKHEFWKKRNNAPEYIEFVNSAEKVKKFLYFMILYGLLGWIIIPFKIWIISFIIMIFLYVIFDIVILRKKRKKRDEALKNIE